MRNVYLGLMGAILLAGCQMAAVGPSPAATAAQGHLDLIKATSIEVKDRLEKAKQEIARRELGPAAADVGQASVSVGAIAPLVDVTKSETQALSDERDSLARQWNEHKDDLANYKKAHNDDWLVPRAHRWILGICAVVSLLGIGYVFLMAAGEMEGGALAGAINVIGHLMTFGLKFVGQLLGRVVAWGLGKVEAAASGAAAVLEKAAPNQPASSRPAAATQGVV